MQHNRPEEPNEDGEKRHEVMFRYRPPPNLVIGFMGANRLSCATAMVNGTAQGVGHTCNPPHAHDKSIARIFAHLVIGVLVIGNYYHGMRRCQAISPGSPSHYHD